MGYNKALNDSINRNNLSEALGTGRCHYKMLSGRSWWVIEGSADCRTVSCDGAINTLFIIIVGKKSDLTDGAASKIPQSKVN